METFVEIPRLREGFSFLLESREACVEIPKSFIEKNMKSWDNFILGQFTGPLLLKEFMQFLMAFGASNSDMS